MSSWRNNGRRRAKPICNSPSQDPLSYPRAHKKWGIFLPRHQTRTFEEKLFYDPSVFQHPLKKNERTCLLDLSFQGPHMSSLALPANLWAKERQKMAWALHHHEKATACATKLILARFKWWSEFWQARVRGIWNIQMLRKLALYVLLIMRESRVPSSRNTRYA